MKGPNVSWPWRGAHLAVLWAFAFVQPLLDLLGGNAEFFVARDNGAADILVFSIALTVLPPLVLLGLEALVRLASARAAWRLHLALVGLLAAAFALQLLDGLIGGSGVFLLVGALALGVIAAAGYGQREEVRSLLSYLSPAPVLFLALFLLFSDASELVLPQEEVEALGASGAQRTPVLFVQLDELPPSSLTDGRGGIDARRFPSFAELARESTWYRNATTIADHTDDAVPAILTGSRPDSSLDPVAANYPDNLFTLLAGDKALNVHERTANLCPESYCESRPSEGFAGRMRALVDDLSVVSGHLLLPDSLAGGLPPVNEGFSGFAAAAGTGDLFYVGIDQGAIAAFYDGIERDPDALHYIHLTLPHHPWRFLPTGQDYSRGDVWREWEEEDERWLPGRQWVTKQAQRAHLLQSGYADLILGEAIDRLKATGEWNRALVVVMADHGVSFTPGTPRRYAEERNVGQVASIPLFIKAPGQQQGEVDDAPVTTIDVLPTIAEILGVEIPFPVDGKPAGEVAGERDELSVLRGDEDEPRTFSFEEILAQQRRAAARVTRLFGYGWEGVWRMGPNSELIGTRVGGAPDLPGATFALTSAEAYEDVDPKGDYVPALVIGRLEGVDEGTPMAVAINGRVAAVSEAYESVEGGMRANFLVPPQAFRDGSNRVEVLAVERGPSGLALQAIPGP